MEKSPVNSDDMSEHSADGQLGHDSAPVELPGQVLVTFRGVAVDENVVRYAQQCARELGWNREGSLHAVLTLTNDSATEPYVAVARGGIDTRRYEQCARAGNAFAALQRALDALRAQLGWTDCAC